MQLLCIISCQYSQLMCRGTLLVVWCAPIIFITLVKVVPLIYGKCVWSSYGCPTIYTSTKRSAIGHMSGVHIIYLTISHVHY